jgi:Rrf2 family protein
VQLVVLAGDLGPKWFHIALRALVLIAKSEDPLTSTQLAEKLGAESTFVRKILIRLIKNNLVISYPGRYGGYSLGKPAAEITVLDVYQTLVDTIPTPYYSVTSTGSEYFISLIITKAEKEFQSVLGDFTIDELLNNTNE